MRENNMKRMVIVLGAGRSGTSLLMHLLHSLGMAVSEKMIEPRYHNPLGPMEDLEIAQVFDDVILPSCKMNRLVPLSIDRREIDMIGLKKGEKQLKEILQQRLKATLDTKTWGFKDPVVSNLLPQLFPIFNQLKVAPKFVLCVRNPASVVRSRSSSFQTSPSLSELAWLTNTVNVIKDTGADCFIVHYEDLLSEKNRFEVLRDLSEYLCLDIEKFSEAEKIIKNNLNRQSHSDYKIENKEVTYLYGILRECKGVSFDRDALLEAVGECNEKMLSYKGWLQYAYEAVALKQDVKRLNKELQELREEKEDCEKIKSNNESLRFNKKQLINELKIIGDGLERYNLF